MAEPSTASVPSNGDEKMMADLFGEDSDPAAAETADGMSLADMTGLDWKTTFMNALDNGQPLQALENILGSQVILIRN